jgi:hypothetical protein
MESLPVVCLHLISFIIGWVLFALEYACNNSTQVVWAGICTYTLYLVLCKVFTIKISVHPATAATFHSMVAKFQQESMFCDPIETTDVDITSDADLVSDADRKDNKLVRSHRRIPYAVRVAHVAKAQVGLLSNIKANELVYARICREEMIKNGVRPSHIAHMVPLAVAACFIPLDADFLAASIRQSALMKDRRALLGSFESK